MNKTTKTVIILGLLTLGGYLVFKSMKPKGEVTPPPPPPPPPTTECPKCGTIRCGTGTHAEEVGECGCECVKDKEVIDSHPAPPQGCRYDKSWNLICDGDVISGGDVEETTNAAIKYEGKIVQENTSWAIFKIENGKKRYYDAEAWSQEPNQAELILVTKAETDSIPTGENMPIIDILPPPIFTGGGDEVFDDGSSSTPVSFDFANLLNTIKSVYLKNNFPFDLRISAEINVDLKRMTQSELNTVNQFFSDALNDVDTSQSVEDNMDLIFGKFPSLGKPFVVKSDELQDAINQMATSRQAPSEDGGGSPTFLGLSEATTKDIMAVGDVIAGAAAILLTGGVGVAVAACWGLAKKVFGLFRKKNK